MMDTVMVGKLGEASLSASSLANQFYNIFVFLCMGISAAGVVLSSQYFGAKDLKIVRRVFDVALQIVVISGAAFAVNIGANYIFIFGKLGAPAIRFPVK